MNHIAKYSIVILFTLSGIFFTTGKANAEIQPSLTIDPECGTLGHAPCVPGVNAPLPKPVQEVEGKQVAREVEIPQQTTQTTETQTTLLVNTIAQPTNQSSNCGSLGLPPCIPGVNAPLPPKKTFDLVPIPSQPLVGSFDILNRPYKLALTNPSEPFDVVIQLKPYTEQQQRSEVYTLERKLIPRAYEDPDVFGSFSSDVFEIAVKRNQSPLNALPSPITITLPWPSDIYMKKIIHYWDSNASEWLPLSSTSDFKAKTVSAVWHLPYGQFSVFDDMKVFEGIASWYAYKGCNCAAIKEFKRGTQFRVTNITEGSPRIGKPVTVTINDYGPAVWTKRLIDLDKTAFSQIASTWNGLAMVRVELL